MATATHTGSEIRRPDDLEIRIKSERWKTFRTYVGVALIIVWGLAPAYWMVVTAFRNVGYTFDSTPWPTHVTLDNFRTAFSTSRGNTSGAR